MKKIIYILLLIILVISCGKNEDESKSKKENNEKTEQKSKEVLTKYDLISSISNGLVFHKNEILIKFNKKHVKVDRMNVEAEKSLLKIKPSINGKLYWKEENVLAFKANPNWKKRTQYKATLDISKLNLKEKTDFKEFEFEFETTGLEVYDIEADVNTISREDPKKIKIEGKISFNDKVTEEKLKKALKLYHFDKKGEKVYEPISLQQYKNDKTFKFRSIEIERDTNSDIEKYITIENKVIDIPEEITKNITIPMLKALNVSEVKIIQNNEKAIAIKFSDILEKDMDLNGFFEIEPKINFRISKGNRQVKLIGDFKNGESYKLIVKKGIRTKWGTKLNDRYTQTIKLKDLAPKAEFLNAGVFLPSSNKQKIRFRSQNISNATIIVKKIYSDNIFFFLQDYDLEGQKDRNQNEGYNFYRIGEKLYEKKIEIGESKNSWIKSEIDLEKVFVNDKNGLYFLEIIFTENDVLGNHLDDMRKWKKSNYIRNAKVYKPIILSDIGLYAKKLKSGYHIQVLDLISGKPMPNAKILAKSFQNQLILESESDENGICKLNDPNKKIFYIEARNGEQSTILKLNKEMEMSGYDLEGDGGNTKQGFDVYMYTERGVYRPGDKINLSLILREENKTVSDNFPVKYSFYNPKNKVLSEGVNKNSENGFYNFELQTKSSDLTGDWKFEIEVGTVKFSKIIKVETVVPQKIRVNLESDKKEYDLNTDDKIKIALHSEYLFGNPAKGMDTDFSIVLGAYNFTAKGYNNYVFSSPLNKFEDVEHQIRKEKLDDQGNTEIEWELPKLKKVPSGLRLKVTGKVYEKSGRSVSKSILLPVKKYRRFVGMERPDSRYLKTGSDINLKTVLINNEGQLIDSGKLRYRVYKNQYYWWWDYDSKEEYRRHFKSNWNTELLEEGELILENGEGILSYIPQEYGEIYVEVEDAVGGHSAGLFFRAYSWGDESNAKVGEKLQIKTDKKSYEIGDIATIIFDSPIGANAYITIEKEDKILKSYKKEIVNKETELDIKITEDHFPNAYVSVYIVQAHGQSKNDTPIRQYGYASLVVNNKDKLLNINIESDDEILPNSDFEVNIQVEDNKRTQFTIAVVDEGLLNITNFRTPEPYKHFYMTKRLAIQNYDMMSEVIGLNLDEVHKTYIIGGDSYREKQLKKGRQEVERFKPVTMFKGPMWTDENGKATVKFNMPNYVGSVRAMVVAARDEKYAGNSKDIVVKAPLMILPSLPRKLSPGDKVEVPVTLFATEDGIGELSLKLDVEGPISIIGDSEKKLILNEKGESDQYFQIEVGDEVGKGKIKITAQSKEHKVKNETEIAINSSNMYTYIKKNYDLNTDENLTVDLISNVLKGTNKTKITISKYKKLMLDQRIKWLMRYPYGCIEQTTSTVLPQLFLEKVVDSEELNTSKISNNINAGIKKLRRFQLSNGAFAYWPGNDHTSVWGTNYAGHFLVEAKKAGYHISESMYNKYIEYQKETAIQNTAKEYSNFYRLYILALAGDAEIGAMNYMREAYKTEMTNREKWLLGASYALIGEEAIAKEIVKNAKYDVKNYREYGGTYGSSLRDKAMMLEASYHIKGMNKGNLYSEIVDRLESDNWLSTQETAYSLLALSRYIETVDKNDKKIQGEIIDSKGKTHKFMTKQDKYVYISDAINGNIKIKSETDAAQFATMEWEGVPKDKLTEEQSYNINLDVNYFDENGKELDVTKLSQGDSFWIVYTVYKDRSQDIEEVALVQNLPSAWEIENIRLTGVRYPDWIRRLTNFGREEYLDIRDDKIMWFFDMKRYSNQYTFATKINVVTVGEFYMPGARAEAMYDHGTRASVLGKDIKVIRKK